LALDNQLEPVDRIMDHPTEVIRIEARFSEIVLGTPFYGERSYMIIGYVDQHDNRDGRCGGIRNELLQNRKPLHIRQPSTEKGAGGIHDSPRGADDQ